MLWARRRGTWPSHGNSGFRHIRIQHRGVDVEHFWTERIDVKANGGGYIGDGLFVRVPLPNDDSLEAERVGDVAVRMLLDNDLDLSHTLPPIHHI